MKFSDVIFNIGTRQFPAHKSILASRSEVFEAMFTHSTKEKLTNRIDIEDIEPEVFQELLHFIYTGRLSTTTMDTLAVGLLIAADKYLLIVLKNECENYLLRKMSPENCVELILRDDLFNPPENLEKVLKEAAKRFQLLPGDVMATAKWEKMEKENPQMLFKIQKILFSKNGVQKFV
jgi:speckle-type POZ protein